MNLLPIVLGIGLAVCNCSTTQPADDAWNRRADGLYADTDHSVRCEQIYTALRENLMIGMTSREAGVALRSIHLSDWLANSSSQRMMLLAGFVPVDFSAGRTFVMHLYPNQDNWSNYRIYFSISVPEGYDKPFSVSDFLTGNAVHPEVRLHQYAFSYGKSRDGHETELFPRDAGNDDSLYPP